MDFVNHTPFPAQAFEGIDRHGAAFHVVVLRQTLSFASGTLEYDDVQAPLCESDLGFDDDVRSGTRQESDLCHYKPLCDILVNATAHAPAGARRSFPVRLTVREPSMPAPLPARPQGLNQFEDATPAIMARWRQAVKHAQEHPVPGNCILEKTLLVTGLRQFVKKSLPTRLLHLLICCLTLGLSRPNPWKLTRPDIVETLPLRPEVAFGGECRIDEGMPAARRLPASQPSLHAACMANPLGAGFAEATHLKATRTRSVAAPQVERPDAQIDARRFWRSLRGLPDKAAAAKPDRPDPFEPAGLGVRHKGHPARRALAGTVDQSFIDGGHALPADFDFAFWNAAPADQQVRYLRGDEIVELVNLCAAGTPGAATDAQGNTWLHLTLPRDECFVLCRLKNGTLFEQALALDTVLIEPEDAKLTLVWRGVIEQTANGPLRACEARMRSHEERDLARQARDQQVVQVTEALLASLRGHVGAEATR